MKSWLTPSLGCVALLILAIGLALRYDGCAAPAPESAPPDAFSAERAWRHLRAIAQKPRPTGSEANRRARAYLYDALRAMNLEVEVQTAISHERAGSVEKVGFVANVLARIPGKSSDRAVLLSSHYDSTPHSPGANDDGVGTAALLETARAIQAGPRLKHDVIIALVDGEESGLFGARVFAQEHPWAKATAVALNFEGRGARGPVQMFQTSPGNDSLIRLLAQAPHPIGSSLAGEVYRRMPNDTDFTEYRQAGMQGLNFAHIAEPNHYHTALDDLVSVDSGVLQQQGANALALARLLGDAELPLPDQTDRIYFNAPPLGFFHYPNSLVLPLCLIALALYGTAVWLGFRRGALTLRSLATGLLATLLILAIATLAAGGVWRLIRLVHPDFGVYPPGHPHHSGWHLLGFGLLTAFWFLAAGRLCQRWATPAGFALGGLVLWLPLAGFAAFSFVGGSYLFVWPPLLTAAGLLAGFAAPKLSAPGKTLIATLAGLLGLWLVLPTAAGLFWAFSMTQVHLTALLIGLGLTACLAPFCALEPKPFKLAAPLTAVAAAACLSAPSFLNREATPRHPDYASVFYLIDRDVDQAWWLSTDREPTPWTDQFFDDSAGRAPAPEALGAESRFLQAGAERSRVSAPKAQLLAEREENGERIVSLRLFPNSGAINLHVRPAADVALRRATVAGIELAPGWQRLDLFGAPQKGVTLELTAPAGQPVAISLLNVRYGLPPDLQTDPRPANVIAPYRFQWLQDATLVRQTYTF